MTTEDKERLHGQISYVASKSEFDPAALVALVRQVTRMPASAATGPS